MTAEKINPIDHSVASSMILNAMVKQIPKDSNVFKVFGIEQKELGDKTPTLIDVELIVNGVSVPFKHTIEDVWRQLNDNYNEKLLQKALELVSASSLHPLQEALENAEWEIKQALNKIIGEENGT